MSDLQDALSFLSVFNPERIIPESALILRMLCFSWFLVPVPGSAFAVGGGSNTSSFIRKRRAL
jgi:hypothetical protein